MGYSHYYYRPWKLDSARFAMAVADCRKICEALPIPLGNWEGKGKPKFTKSEIRFNGHVHSDGFARDGDGLMWPSDGAAEVAVVGESAVNGSWCAGATASARCVASNGDGSYETFSLKRVLGKDDYIRPNERLQFSFCKTNYRPYDLDVQCCLIVFKHFFGDNFLVRSDGIDEQWNEARNDVQAVLGYGLDFELDKQGVTK